jgi:hypothetical protein
MIILKSSLKELSGGGELDSASPGCGSNTVCCEHGDEHSSSVEGEYSWLAERQPVSQQALCSMHTAIILLCLAFKQ